MVARVLLEDFESGSDSSDLWITDGTVTGTREVVVGNAAVGGLFTGSQSKNFTNFGNEAL